MKFSGVVTELGDDWHAEALRPYFDALIEIFGAERVMWGSDWPVIDRAGGFDRWYATVNSLASSLSNEERGWVLGGSAAAFYVL